MGRDVAARAQILASTADEAFPPPAPATHPRRLPLVQWVGLIIVVLVAVELTCRIEDWVTYRTPILSRVTGLNDLVVRDADGMHGRPNTQYQKWRMNALGLRGDAATPVPAVGTTRIIVAGASETFGLYESPDKEYPAQLGDSLRARVKGGACRLPKSDSVEVLNAALAGMSLPTTEQDIRLRLRRFHPDIVLIYPAPAGYLDELPPRAAAPDSLGSGGDPSWTHALHLRMLDRGRAQIKELLPDFIKTLLRRRESAEVLKSHGTGWQFERVPEERLALYDNDLRRTVAAVRQIGATPVLATHANIFIGRQSLDLNQLQAWQKFYPRATGATIVAFDSAARARTLEIGLSEHVRTIDAAAALGRAPTSAFADFVHFTDLGAARMAQSIAKGLCSSSSD